MLSTDSACSSPEASPVLETFAKITSICVISPSSWTLFSVRVAPVSDNDISALTQGNVLPHGRLMLAWKSQ